MLNIILPLLAGISFAIIAIYYHVILAWVYRLRYGLTLKPHIGYRLQKLSLNK
jgi:hypothetical protein